MATCSNLLCLLIVAGSIAAAHGEVDTTVIRLPTDDNTDRPWDCCDDLEKSPLAVFPPFYSCNDEVKKCNANCKECVEAPGDFPRAWICRDWYRTEDPGPICKARPWGKCCDSTICKESLPPICQCRDVVEKCAASCKKCEPVKSPDSGPPRFVCRDEYKGEPGRKCTL